MHNENEDDLKLCTEELGKVSETSGLREEGFGELPNLPFSESVLTGGSYNMIRDNIDKI